MNKQPNLRKMAWVMYNVSKLQQRFGIYSPRVNTIYCGPKQLLFKSKYKHG